MKHLSLTPLATAVVLILSVGAAAQTDPGSNQPAVDSALRIDELIDRTSAEPGDANAWTQLGILYIDEGMLPEARAAFISALQAAPAEPSSHLNLAVCLVRMENWGESLGPLQSYRQMVPEDVRGWALAGQAMVGMNDTDGAVDIWLEGSRQSAMPEGDRILLVTEATGALLHSTDDDTDPTDEELVSAGEILDAESALLDAGDARELRVRRDFTWIEMARRQLEAGDTAAALASWEHLRQTGSVNPTAWTQPLQVLLDANRIDEAARLAQDASTVLPGSAIVEFLNGRVAEARGDHGTAARHYKEASRLDPDLPGIWSALGETLAKSGDTKGASDALAEAVRRGQGGAAAAYNMGVVLSQKKQFKEAIPYLEDAIEADPDNRDAYRALGTAYRKEKRYGDATTAYQAILDRFGPDSKDLYQLAFCEAKDGKNGPAAAHYEMVTAMQPDNVNAFYGLGNALSKNGDYDRAGTAFESALALKPDYHGASFGWALALQKQGDFEAAIDRYELTREIKETYSSYVNLAICYKNLGDEESSDEYYALANELKKKGR
jgi:tetratricopeptide (TPR) repeat protein